MEIMSKAFAAGALAASLQKLAEEGGQPARAKAGGPNRKQRRAAAAKARKQRAKERAK